MGKKIALTICEDLWDEQPFDNEFEKSRLYTISPMEELSKFNPDLSNQYLCITIFHTKSEAKENIFRYKAEIQNPANFG